MAPRTRQQTNEDTTTDELGVAPKRKGTKGKTPDAKQSGSPQDQKKQQKNRVKILFEDHKGTELGPWLARSENQELIKDQRILYVTRANMDNGLIKFGVGGVEHGKTGAYGRLLQYINYYGVTGEFDCRGIKLFMIAGNNYNVNVEGKDSAIFLKEKFLKAQLKGDTLSGRGTERVTTNLVKLFNLIKRGSNKTDEDIETARRKSDLLAQRNIARDDQVLQITGHETLRTGKTTFLTHWNRATIVPGKMVRGKDGRMSKTPDVKDYTTREPYSTLITLLDGKEKADEYMAKHRRAKFNL